MKNSRVLGSDAILEENTSQFLPLLIAHFDGAVCKEEVSQVLGACGLILKTVDNVGSL